MSSRSSTSKTTEPRATETYGVWVNEDTVLIVTTFTSGERAEISLSLDQARHLAFRLNEACAVAPQLRAKN